PLRIPHPDAPLHLYRHLLREATYVSPICRPWTTDRIKARFRNPRSRFVKEPKGDIKKAHKALRFLRAANAGHVERMVMLCYLATGRHGKRRRELSASYLAKEPPVDSSSLEELTTSRNVTSDKQSRRLKGTEKRFSHPDWLDNWSTDKMKALAESQYANQQNDWPHQMRRLFDPRKHLPTENCWGQPFNPKLARRKLAKHYVQLLKSLIPPLPQGEWDQLKQLTLGEAEASMFDIPSRRPVATPMSSPNGSSKPDDGKNTLLDRHWDWARYATRSIRHIEVGNSRNKRVLSGGVDENPRGQGHPIGVRAFKPRSLRRNIYGKVWLASPTMKKRPNGTWNITWGNVSPKFTQPSKNDLSFFKG
ncbi:uncharacterized protein BCR38DRAFT_328267, partial [Pseudomassariella vexata]